MFQPERGSNAAFRLAFDQLARGSAAGLTNGGSETPPLEVLMFTSCVYREVAPGDTQLVPVAEVPFLFASDRIFTGEFTSQAENHGPSGSHSRTVCQAIGRPSESRPCVLRDVAFRQSEDHVADMQYVPVNEVPASSLVAGETLYAGAWRRSSEKRGPYGSHTRTVCQPVGAPVGKPFSVN
jgi:hypothetical protein